MVLLLLCLAPAAQAQTVSLTPCVSPVRAGDTDISVLFQKARFRCDAAQTKFASGDYWVRMDVPSTSLDQRPSLVFSSLSLWDDGMSISVFDEMGTPRRYQVNANSKPGPVRLGQNIVVPIRVDGSAVRAIVVRVENSANVRGILLAPKLSTPYWMLTQELIFAALYAGFIGICLGLLVYNGALWWAMRERFLLAYCATLVAMIGYTFMTSGVLHYLVEGLSSRDRLRLTVPVLTLLSSAGIWFVSCFFIAAAIPRWLRLATAVQIALLPVVGLAYAFFAPINVKLLDTICTSSFAPLPLIFIAYLTIAWRDRDPLLPYFIIGWSFPFAAVTLRVLRGYDVVPPFLLIEHSALIALTFQALISSLAIGYRVRLMAQARDRAEMAEAHARAMADTDPLTGLLNRRAFLRSILERKSNWTLLLLDIDHFKRVNDALGHAGGDEAIIQFARALENAVPPGALIARMGGEEFAIVYRGNIMLIDPDDLLAQIRQINLQDGYRITASMGIANRNVASDDDWKILYRAADMALYRAKTNGRDRYLRTQLQSIAA